MLHPRPRGASPAQDPSLYPRQYVQLVLALGFWDTPENSRCPAIGRSTLRCKDSHRVAMLCLASRPIRLCNRTCRGCQCLRATHHSMQMGNELFFRKSSPGLIHFSYLRLQTGTDAGFVPLTRTLIIISHRRVRTHGLIWGNLLLYLVDDTM